MLRLLVPIAVVLLLAGGGPTAVAAQDATPMASPTAGTCDAPALPPGTPSPMEEPVGTPDAAMAGTPDPQAAGEAVATQAAMEASPAATPAGTPADAETADRVEAAIRNPINCYNTGEYLAVAALFTANGLLGEFGTANPYDLPLFLEGGSPLTIQSIGDVQTHADGRFSADVVSTFGAQLQHERWFLVEDGAYLLVDGTPDLPVDVPAGSAEIAVTLTDFAFALSADTVPAGTIAMRGTNDGEYFHEIAVAKFPEGFVLEDPMALLEGPPPEGTEFFGGAAGPPGESFDLVLLDLTPGVYTLLCFVDEPDGTPHVAKGMIATLTVE